MILFSPCDCAYSASFEIVSFPVSSASSFSNSSVLLFSSTSTSLFSSSKFCRIVKYDMIADGNRTIILPSYKYISINSFLHYTLFTQNISWQQSAMSVGDTLQMVLRKFVTWRARSWSWSASITIGRESHHHCTFPGCRLHLHRRGEKNWVLFLAWSLNSMICVWEVRGDSIIITWDAIPLSDTEVISVHDLTLVLATEMNFCLSVCSLFIQLPCIISQDSSKIRKGPALSPPAKEKWLVIVILFDMNVELDIALTPLIVV